MINSTALATQDVLLNKNLIFDQDQVRTKSSRNPYTGWLDYNPHSGDFILTKPGIYRVSYNAAISSVATGIASISLMANGLPVQGSETEYEITESGMFGSVAATSLIRVAPYQFVPVSLANTSELKLKIKNANIIIDKVA